MPFPAGSQVFWLGDLNYRITDVDVDKVKEMIDRGAMEKVRLAGAAKFG